MTPPAAAAIRRLHQNAAHAKHPLKMRVFAKPPALAASYKTFAFWGPRGRKPGPILAMKNRNQPLFPASNHRFGKRCTSFFVPFPGR
jgi:hypothetical protein